MICRSVPLQNSMSPAQMLMGKRIRIFLPVHENLLKARGTQNVKKPKKQKKRHNKNARHLPHLKPGTKVCLPNHTRTGARGSCGLFLLDPNRTRRSFEKKSS